MPRNPKLLAGLSLANGILTLITATVFALGRFGSFGATLTGGFRSIGGLLVVFAAITFLTFCAGPLLLPDRRAVALIGGMAFVDGLANAFFVVGRLAGFYVPEALHWLNGMLCALVVFLAVIELVTSARDPERLAPWPVAVALAGSSVGGVALLAGIGRYEWAMGVQDRLAIAGSSIAVAIIGLTLFALGTGGVTGALIGRDGMPGARFLGALIIASVLLCGATVRVAVGDVDAASIRGALRPPADPWSGAFWVLLTATLASAIMLGAILHRPLAKRTAESAHT